MPPLRAWFLGTAVVVLSACLVFLWIWNEGAESRAIRSLPVHERAALYRRTLDDLAAVCGPAHARDLDAHCNQQADFILKFPECGASCQSLARAGLSRPTR